MSEHTPFGHRKLPTEPSTPPEIPNSYRKPMELGPEQKFDEDGEIITQGLPRGVINYRTDGITEITPDDPFVIELNFGSSPKAGSN